LKKQRRLDLVTVAVSVHTNTTINLIDIDFGADILPFPIAASYTLSFFLLTIPIPIIPPANSPNAKFTGSGTAVMSTAVMSNSQLTNELVPPPPDASAKNSVHVPFGS
jgi:hypothetical protein